MSSNATPTLSERVQANGKAILKIAEVTKTLIEWAINTSEKVEEVNALKETVKDLQAELDFLLGER